MKFWSLSPRAERLLAPFWRENEETLKPIAPSGKKIEITKADPSEVQYYLGKVLDRKQKQLVHSEAMRGLLAVCREHHLPLGEGQYADILKGFRVLLENHSTSKDVRDDLLRALEAIEYNSFSIGDKETIVCIRDNFLERLEELQRVDPWRATPPLDYLLSEDERLGIYQDLVRNWMEDVVDDESYLMNLQCLLPHLTVMYKNKLKEVREWLFGLMDSANERISSRAANLHRTLT